MVHGIVRPTEDEVEEHRKELIASHLGSELAEAQKLQELYEEGYNPITNKFGEFKVNREANQKRKNIAIQSSRNCRKPNADRKNSRNSNVKWKSKKHISDEFICLGISRTMVGL
jgi:hypothetical protein